MIGVGVRVAARVAVAGSEVRLGVTVGAEVDVACAVGVALGAVVGVLKVGVCDGAMVIVGVGVDVTVIDRAFIHIPPLTRNARMIAPPTSHGQINRGFSNARFSAAPRSAAL